jgi:hypothetical protein
MILLAMETNRYYHSHLDRLEDGPSPLPDMTEAEMLVFLVIIQMRQCIQDKLTDFRSTTTNSTHISTVVL